MNKATRKKSVLLSTIKENLAWETVPASNLVIETDAAGHFWAFKSFF